MLLARICAGYPVRAEARASVECEVMVPMLFLLETHTHAHTHGHPHTYACPLRLSVVCAWRVPLLLHTHSRTLLKGVNLRERVFADDRLVVVATPGRLALHNHKLRVAAAV